MGDLVILIRQPGSRSAFIGPAVPWRTASLVPVILACLALKGAVTLGIGRPTPAGIASSTIAFAAACGFCWTGKPARLVWGWVVVGLVVG